MALRIDNCFGLKKIRELQKSYKDCFAGYREAIVIAMQRPPAATLLTMLLLLLAAAALTVCFQPTDRVPGVAVRYYSLSGSPTQV